jgi:glycosyltransferase involved in cell wall biosynthesis
MPPSISVLIPVCNEEEYIAPCLDAVLANDYPQDCLEILVVDGMSTDRSREIIQAYTITHRNVRMLENRKRIVSSAMNIGIREAQGEIVVRMDAHAVCAPDYVRTCVRLLQTTEAANVGGAQRAVGTDYVSRAIAIGMTSLFGVGNAAFRRADRNTWVDTVYLGAWYRSTVESLGGFDEDWVINQDYELNVRLRRAGGRILLSPEIRCWYYVRSTIRALARQWVRYGYWRAKTLVAYPGSLQWRQLAPPSLVAALILSLAVLPLSWSLGLAVPVLYLAASLLAAGAAAARKGWQYYPLLPLVFGTIHLSWGAGFLVGMLRWSVRRLAWHCLVRSLSASTVTGSDGEGPKG